MTETEEFVLQAAFDLRKWESALDHGCPAQEQKKRAYADLMDACDNLAAEHDGELRITSA